MLIIVKPALFTRKTKVTVMNEETKKVEKTFDILVNELSVQIPQLCKETNTNKILLIGNKNFNTKIGQTIKSCGIAQYGLNIEIEYA